MNSSVKKSRRIGLYGPYIGLLVVALGWSCLWLYGRYRVGLELDNFFVKQAGVGRQWSCPDRSISGYPFRIEIRCNKPTFRGEFERRAAVNGSVEGLTVIATTAGALTMAHVIAEMKSPLVVREEQGLTTTVSWTSAQASFRGLHNRVERSSIVMSAPTIKIANAAGRSLLDTKADQAEMHLREGVDPARPDSYDFSMKLVNVVQPELDPVFGNRDPINAELDARLLKVTGIDRRDWRISLDNWRAAGGTIKVEKLQIAKGQPRIEANGDLRLDGEKRLNGRLDASFVNMGPLLQQLGIGGRAGGAAGLLGGLLGGTNPAQQQDRALRLPLVLENGRVAVGPFRIPNLQMAPLY
jgi:hypothetical protein